MRTKDGGTCVDCGTELYPWDETYPSDRCKDCLIKYAEKLNELGNTDQRTLESLKK